MTCQDPMGIQGQRCYGKHDWRRTNAINVLIGTVI